MNSVTIKYVFNDSTVYIEIYAIDFDINEPSNLTENVPVTGNVAYVTVIQLL